MHPEGMEKVTYIIISAVYICKDHITVVIETDFVLFCDLLQEAIVKATS
jgi:hypothetical protein